jgi:hypothetical protein
LKPSLPMAHAIDARPQCLARWHSSHTAVHHLVEHVNVMTSSGPEPPCDHHPRVPPQRARLASGGAPRQPRHPAGRPCAGACAAGFALISAAQRQPAWNYTAPWWLPGGHAQTIWAPLFSHAVNLLKPGPPRTGARAGLHPDGDFIDLDWLDGPKASPTGVHRPLVVLFHGLEGNCGWALCTRLCGGGAIGGNGLCRPTFPRL